MKITVQAEDFAENDEVENVGNMIMSTVSTYYDETITVETQRYTDIPYRTAIISGPSKRRMRDYFPYVIAAILFIIAIVAGVAR